MEDYEERGINAMSDLAAAQDDWRLVMHFKWRKAVYAMSAMRGLTGSGADQGGSPCLKCSTPS